MRKRIFRIRYKNKEPNKPIIYTTIKALYEANREEIGITIGGLMNAVCRKEIWENDNIIIERLYVKPMIEENGTFSEVNI